MSLRKQQQKLDYFSQHLKDGQIIKASEMAGSATQSDDSLDEEEQEVADVVVESGRDSLKVGLDQYNLKQLEIDIDRDRRLLELLIQICQILQESDSKLDELCRVLDELTQNKQKVLLFSCYIETIKYLKVSLPSRVEMIDFGSQAGFTTDVGGSRELTQLADRFSPKSRGASNPKPSQTPIDYLFATDRLSEGYNLQDCGVIINYDLHWNPVRMIQRNGRVNRLGSPHERVDVYNFFPASDLERQLNIISRLRHKIDLINKSIGSDQAIIDESDDNPIEYQDSVQTTLGIYDQKRSKDIYDQLNYDDMMVLFSKHEAALARFRQNESVETQKRVRDIPAGKWGYMPAKTETEDRAPALGLSQTSRAKLVWASVFQPLFYCLRVKTRGHLSLIPIRLSIGSKPLLKTINHLATVLELIRLIPEIR